MYLVLYLSCHPSQPNLPRQRTWCSSALARIRVDGLDAKSAANYYTATIYYSLNNSSVFVIKFLYLNFKLNCVYIQLRYIFNCVANSNTGFIILRGPIQILQTSYLHVKQEGSKLIQEFYLSYILNQFYMFIIRRFSSSILSECHVFLFIQIICSLEPQVVLRLFGIGLRYSCTKTVILDFGMTNLAGGGVG